MALPHTIINQVKLDDVRRRLEKIDLICQRQANIHFNKASTGGSTLFDDSSDIGMAKVFALIKHAVIECLNDLEGCHDT